MKLELTLKKYQLQMTKFENWKSCGSQVVGLYDSYITAKIQKTRKLKKMLYGDNGCFTDIDIVSNESEFWIK